MGQPGIGQAQGDETEGQGRPISRRRRVSVLSGATIGHMTGVTPTVHATFGLLLIPLTHAFGWSRTVVSTGLALLSLICMVGYPLAGRYADRHGAWRIVTFGTLAFAIVLACGGMISGSIWQLYLLYACLGVGATLVNPTLYLKMLSETHARDMGFAAGFAGGIGVGVGYALVTLGGSYVLVAYGWRATYVAVAAFVFFVGLVAQLGLMRSVGAPPRVPVVAMRQAPQVWTSFLSRGDFWLIFIGLALMGGLMVAVLAHLIPILVGHGVPVREAAEAVAVCNVLLLPGQPICGLIVDRYGLRIMVLPYLLTTVGLLLLLIAHDWWFIVFACVTFGIGNGAQFCVIPVTVQRCFGLESFSAVMGLLYIGLFVGEGLGPVVLDSIYDRLGSYQPALMGAAALTVVGAAMTWRLAVRSSAGAARSTSHVIDDDIFLHGAPEHVAAM